MLPQVIQFHFYAKEIQLIETRKGKEIDCEMKGVGVCGLAAVELIP